MARLFDDASTQYLQYTGAVLSSLPITLVAWFYSDDAANAQDILAIARSSSDTPYIRLVAGGNVVGDPVLAIHRDDANTQSLAQSATGYSVNTWAHGAAVFASGTSRTAYINGVAGTTLTASIGTTTVDRTAIGRLPRATPAAYFSGRIAEAAIYSVALTTDEIASLYNNGIGLSPKMVRPDALVAYWPLLQTDGDIDWWGQFNMTAGNSPTHADHNPVEYPGGIASVQLAQAAGNRRRRTLICGAR